MLALKIIGIVLLCLIALVFLLLMQNIKLVFYFSTEGKLKLLVKYSFITLFDSGKTKKNNKAEMDDSFNGESDEEALKKESKFKKFIMKKLGLTPLTGIEALKETSEKNSLSDTTVHVLTLFTLFAGQLLEILKRMRIKHFNFKVTVAGDDAADTAMEYGLVCSALYPFLGYLDANLKQADRINAIVGCDFEGESALECDIFLKLRLIHVTNTLMSCIVSLAKNAQEITLTEDKK